MLTSFSSPLLAAPGVQSSQMFSYRDNLLRDWEKKQESLGISRRDVLIKLCKEGVHSRDFLQKKVRKEKKIATPPPPRISKREKKIAARKALAEKEKAVKDAQDTQECS